LIIRFMRSLIFIAALSFSIGAVTAPATANSAAINSTMTERVGFAFYALTRQNPPFEEWIKSTELYDRTQSHMRTRLIDRERERLRLGYLSYTPDRDLIVLRFAVRVRGIKTEATEEGGAISKGFQIDIPGMNDSVQFPFLLGNKWIAVIPDGLTSSSVNPLSDAQYKLMADSIGLNERGSVLAEAELVLKPVAADGQTPMNIESIMMFLMIHDIASFAILDKDRKPLWDITANWYKTEQSREFLNLYKK